MIKNSNQQRIQIYTSTNYEVLSFIQVLQREVIITPSFKIDNLTNGINLMTSTCLTLRSQKSLMKPLEEKRDGEGMAILEGESIWNLEMLI